MMNYPFFTTSPIPGEERFLFVSDLHGLQVQKRIKEALEKYPSVRRVFFLGDVIGTTELAKLQKLFYNVYNQVRAALNQQPNITDNDLLNFKINETVTIGNELNKLIDFLASIGEHDLQFSGEQVRQIANYVHYGHFVGNLGDQARDSLRQGLEFNARSIVDFAVDIAKEYGILFHIVEGNWDARTPLDFNRGTQCLPLPKEKRSFYLGDFVRNNEVYPKYISYSDKPSVVYDHSSRVAFVLWPFDSATTPTKVPKIIFDDYGVVLVSHAHILWSPIKGETPMTAESRNVAINMPMVINHIKAGAAVHGHLHDHIEASGYYYTDNTGIPIPVHYLRLGEIRAISF